MSVDFTLDNIRIKEFPTINLGGGIDFDLDEIRIKELAPVNIGITQIPPVNVGITKLPPININTKVDPLELKTSNKLVSDNTLKSDSTLKTENKVNLALDMRVRELPKIDVQLGLRPSRIRLPLNYRFCFKVLGFKLFEFHTCGEGMVISEDTSAGTGATPE